MFGKFILNAVDGLHQASKQSPPVAATWFINVSETDWDYWDNILHQDFLTRAKRELNFVVTLTKKNKQNSRETCQNKIRCSILQSDIPAEAKPAGGCIPTIRILNKQQRRLCQQTFQGVSARATPPLFPRLRGIQQSTPAGPPLRCLPSAHVRLSQVKQCRATPDRKRK